MLKLIRLEMHRLSWKSILRTIILINIIIFCLLIIMQSDGSGFTSYEEIFFVLALLLGIAYIVYASVLYARIFVQEFRDRTITILFTYPVSRVKILLAKVIFVIGFIFCLIVCSHFILSIFFYMLNKLVSFSITLEPLTTAAILKILGQLIVFSLLCTGLSLFSLFFGMIRTSVPATILSSVLVVFLLNTNEHGDFSAGLPFLMISCLVGYLLASITLWKVLKRDL